MHSVTFCLRDAVEEITLTALEKEIGMHKKADNVNASLKCIKRHATETYKKGRLNENV